MNASIRRALVVEDNPEVNRWLVALLQQAFPRYQVASARDLGSAQARVAQENFHLVMVDLGLPDGSGLELIREMHQQDHEQQIIVITVHDDDASLFAALAAGAQGYLLKEQSDEVLLLQLRQLEQGQPPLSPSIARRMLAHFQQHPPRIATTEPVGALTPRETEVLACIGRGLRVSETARQLGLTDSTVASYIKNIYVRLNISSRAEAALEAARRGLA